MRQVPFVPWRHHRGRWAATGFYSGRWARWCSHLLLTVMLSLVAAGCLVVKPTYQGTAARSDNRQPLEGLAGDTLVWTTRDVAIHYTALRQGDNLRIDGRVERLGPIKNFSKINYFRATIHFLDAEGIIIDSRLLWAAGVGADAKLVRWAFSQSFPLPNETTAFGFSYRGAFSESGADQSGKVGWEVQRTP